MNTTRQALLRLPHQQAPRILLPVPADVTTLHKTWLWPDSLPARILDILECDGPWLTTSNLTHRLDASRNSTNKALKRLKDRQLITSQPIPLPWGHGHQTEHQWTLRD